MQVLLNPIELFQNWLAEAQINSLVNPLIAALATANSSSLPSVRNVAIVKVDETGFTFCTSFNSRKAKELLDNPFAAICFYWPHISKQVRAEGKVESIQTDEADSYFASRPYGKQITSWASKQSQILSDRTEFLARIKYFENEFANKVVPRPKDWSGFKMIPNQMEFLTLEENLRSDRICYTKAANDWHVTRLYP